MTDPIALEHAGHRTWLKWHRGRRRREDPAFSGQRIVEGMRLGASVEVDLVVHAGPGFAVLHDLSLERETTGSGLVADHDAEQMRALRLRAEDGTALDEPVMLLEDLAALLARQGLHADALLQLDYKQDSAVLDPRAVAAFQRSVAPVARHMILSSGDAKSVELLSDGLPELRIGYDPCHDPANLKLLAEQRFTSFVRKALLASPQAEMIYLNFALVLRAEVGGFDLVGAFHAEQRRVDAYTIQRADAQSLPAVRRLLALKVDQITTDDPEGLLTLLARPLSQTA
tara:strand:- start:794 stop:1648 length:855 start_codon:yes stop_codon:yes gene_type:complete